MLPRFSFKSTAKKVTSILLVASVNLTSALVYFAFPGVAAPAYAVDACQTTSSAIASPKKISARVGGVALDQAAKFLADMTDITGAYYDQSLDRVVFVGKKNTVAPKFD
jgi:hypothetical protein